MPSGEFRQTLRRRTRPRDVLALLLVPGALVAVFFLPVPTRESLAFHYANPALLPAFASTFVHMTPTHLAVNLLGYGLVAPLAYVLSVLSGFRQRFYIVCGIYLAVFPLLLAVFGLLFVRRGVGMGFSGVVMAVYGYLPLAMSDFATERFGVHTGTNLAPLLFFVGLAIITVLGLWPSMDSMTVVLGSALLLAAILLILVWYLLSLVDEDASLRLKLATAWRDTGYVELFLLTLIVFLTFPLAMFPPNLEPSGTVVDTYTHLLAYALGFIATYTTAHLGPLLVDETEHGWT